MVSFSIFPCCAFLLGLWKDLEKIESRAEACPNFFYRLGISHLPAHVQECWGEE